MKPTSHTLTLMRHSAGAVIAAAALSGGTRAANAFEPMLPNDATCTVTPQAVNDKRTSDNVEPKKEDEEKKKEEHRDPCPGCGMG